MYTSYSKVNDRFGFSTGGTFKCAYENTRPWITGGLIVLAVIIVLIIINLVYTAVSLANAPADAAAEVETMIYGMFGSGEKPKEGGGAKVAAPMLNVGFGIVGTAFGVLLFVIALIVFAVLWATLRTGQTYNFKADENTFTVIYPKKMNRMITFEYDYITGLKWEEWSFIFAPKCIDVTVITKQGDFMFRLIHTPGTTARGITETPFNIIREKIGLADPDEIYKLTKGNSMRK